MSDETELFQRKKVLLPRGHLEDRHNRLIDDLSRRINCHGGTHDYLKALGGLLMAFYGTNCARWGHTLDEEEAQRLIHFGRKALQSLTADVGFRLPVFYALGYMLILLVEATEEKSR
jgi:hypothetical protein